MSADPPAMSPTNSSALSDLSRSTSPAMVKPNPSSAPQSPSKPPSSAQNQRGSAPAAPSPPTLARRKSHDSDSSLTNLSDEQVEADGDGDGDHDNADEHDEDSDAKDAPPSPGPANKTPRRSVIPDGMWAWASKKSKSKSKSKSKDSSGDEAEHEPELESEEAIESDASAHQDAKEQGVREPSVESTVDRKTHVRNNSIPNRPRTNSLAKELAQLKADMGSGSNETPPKSPSLSEISEEDSGKAEETKPDVEPEVTNEEDADHAEQEVAAPVVVVEAFDRAEGMETLTALEVALAMTRDYLYNTKMQHFAMEEEALNAGTHPELIQQYQELEVRKQARLDIAKRKYMAAVSRIKRKRQEDTDLVMNTWRYERDELKRSMIDTYVSEKRALEREKANLERYSSPRPITPPMPTEFAEEPPKKRVKVEKLIRSVTAKNVQKNIESALTYPSVDGVDGDDLEADLIAMGIRGKPAEPGLGLLPSMSNGHRDFLPIMPQGQGDYHQGPPPQMHQQQFGHQAPLHGHVHHIHAPFTHTHASHSSHLPAPSQQMHHGPPSFSSWGPEPQQSFPSHQHHHHNHVQHNHLPSHMQTLPGLPQHMQSQGPSQSQSSHRMNFGPSQSSSHSGMQGLERPPSSHMHMSSNAQPYSIGGGPSQPTTWNEIRKDRENTMPSAPMTRHSRRSSPVPPHPSQNPHSHRDQSMFPPQMPPGPPIHNHSPVNGPPPSHMASQSSRPGPPPPLEQRRSGEHRSSKSISSKRKAEDEPDMRRDAKRPELGGPSGSHSRSMNNVSPQDQRRDPARSLPSFSVVPPYQQNTANILKERPQPWDQPGSSQPPGSSHTHQRQGAQGSPIGAGAGPLSHNSLPPPSSSRQSQMFPPTDYGRPPQQKSATLPSAMFPSHSHSSSPATHRPPSMMGTHGRPPSPPPAMRKPTVTPPQHTSPAPPAPSGSRSPGKPAYGPPLPPSSQSTLASQPSASNHVRSGESHRAGPPPPAPPGPSRGYGMSKSTSVPSSLSTMGPPLPPINPMNEPPKSDRLPPPPTNTSSVPPPVPVPVPPPTQLPPVTKYGHGLASRLFPSTGLSGPSAGGRSASG